MKVLLVELSHDHHLLGLLALKLGQRFGKVFLEISEFGPHNVIEDLAMLMPLAGRLQLQKTLAQFEGVRTVALVISRPTSPIVEALCRRLQLSILPLRNLFSRSPPVVSTVCPRAVQRGKARHRMDKFFPSHEW